MTKLTSFDPGVKGSLARKDLVSGKVTVTDYPTYQLEKKVYSGKRKGLTSKKTFYDEKALADMVPQAEPGEIALIENVNRMPTDSAHASSLLLYGKGLLAGICVAKGYTLAWVMPAVWKKKLGLVTGSTKEDSRQLALKLFPELAEELKLKKNEGRAESLLLLYYLENFVINKKEKSKKKCQKK